MKNLILMSVVVLMSVTAFAVDYQDKAQKAFDSMSAVEAYKSNKFSKRIWNINMPGTSTWYNPASELCRNGNSVQTVRPARTCSVWSVDLKESEFGKMVAKFTSLAKAKDKAESKNGKGKPYCPDADAIYSTPSTLINYKQEQCVQWQVRTEDGGMKTFSSKAQAEKYADSSSKAVGSPSCSAIGMVAKTFPTTFTVEFYRKVASNSKDSSLFVGEHEYAIAPCDM